MCSSDLVQARALPGPAYDFYSNTAPGHLLNDLQIRKALFKAIDLKTVAGHDALAVQRRAPASLIFVPSRGGISHSAREFTDEAALDKGLAVLVETLWRLVTAP